jgi:hypothetical protein
MYSSLKKLIKRPLLKLRIDLKLLDLNEMTSNQLENILFANQSVDMDGVNFMK